MSKSCSFPPALHYGLHGAIVTVEFTVVAGLIWLETKVSGTTTAWWSFATMIMILLLLSHSLVLIALALLGSVIPHFRRILLATLFLLPGCIATLVFLGMGIRSGLLFVGSSETSKGLAPIQRQNVAQIVQLVAVGCQVAVMAMMLVDLAMSVKLYRRQKRSMSVRISII
ncbi:hypothetical protein C8J56DRAFT_1046108 [Mycena floridula]|nr:hypothetical protein C8J56DRAFT_1046108 [Mycena floridula]